MTDLIDTNDDGKYQTLLESIRAIPWQLNWETKQFTYIGPQIEKLFGWTQASWLNEGDWIDRIHLDDRERTANFCISQSEDSVDYEAIIDMNCTDMKWLVNITDKVCHGHWVATGRRNRLCNRLRSASQ